MASIGRAVCAHPPWPSSRFVGTAFTAADEADVRRLAKANGARRARCLRRSAGWPSTWWTPAVCRLASSRALPTRSVPPQPAQTFNFGAELRRTNAAQRPPRQPARVQRLGHVVVQRAKYRESLNWYLDQLGMIVSDFMFYPGQRDVDRR